MPICYERAHPGPTIRIRFDQNPQGLTWTEWEAASGFKGMPVSETLLMSLHKAWRAGEDPTDWKGAK